MNLLDEFEKLDIYGQLAFLQGVASKYPNRYEYAGLSPYIRAGYDGPLHKQDREFIQATGGKDGCVPPK